MKLRLFVFVLFYLIAQQCLLAQKNISKNRACYQSSANNYNNTAHLTTDGSLTTSWISKTGNSEWIYVDLGANSHVSSINIFWDRWYAKSYQIEVSSTGPKEKPSNWTEVYTELKGNGDKDEINLKSVGARYVRIRCITPAEEKGYSIKEFEVLGNNNLTYKNKPIPYLQPNGKQYLTGGNWKLQRASFVTETGNKISQPAYSDLDWIVATVPGTVLSSYYNNGAVPDHNYGDQQLMISESFFTADFWYRNIFDIPKTYNGKRIWINFDGINWKADIYINGRFLNNINGAFIRGKFDITGYVKPGETNVLAVLIHKNDNPGEVTEQHLKDADNNGGIIGYDSPTFLASIGWNWMPTIRGRNTGIWNDVYLSSTSDVTIDEPFIKTDLILPDTTQANLSIEATLKNHSSAPVNGILKGSIGLIKFEQAVNLKPNEAKSVVINQLSHLQLTIKQPKLWWPNGYGNQPLYKLDLQYVANESISDERQVDFGIREYSYTYENNNLRIFINGYPLIIRGGNWGMAESMLRCDKEGYDLRVKLHKDMNMNMIRNWIGMVGDDEFYEACDKYGIMVWDDFWLANPVDGPHPKDDKMFIANVKDKINQRRNHASLALWCGRNEGYPPASLDSAMQVETFNLDGTRHYISSSAHRPVTGLGPYETKDSRWYFKNRGTTLHSEQGIVAVPSVESMKAMMPEEYLWPINDMWGKHDWTQPRVTIYTDDLERSYGKASDINDFSRKSQMMNMEGPKAMMETWQSNRGPGVLVWMSHPAWPSLICQTYDYFFDPTAAYFAYKKASEPVHVLWRSDNETVEVANNTFRELENVITEAAVYSFDGKLLFSKSLKGNIGPNSIKKILTLSYPSNISPVHFIKLTIKNTSGKVLSDNFYWRGTNYLNYTSLQQMPKVALTANALKSIQAHTTSIKLTLTNKTGSVALMTKIKVLQNKSGKRVLPAFYTDNYISLMPGETKTVNVTFENKFLENDTPKIALEGWNVTEQMVSVK